MSPDQLPEQHFETLLLSPSFVCPQLKMKITDFENRRSFKSIWLNSQFREEVTHRIRQVSHIVSSRWNVQQMNCEPCMRVCCRRSLSTLTNMAVCGTCWKNVKRQWSSLKKALRSSGIHPSGVCVFVCVITLQLRWHWVGYCSNAVVVARDLSLTIRNQSLSSHGHWSPADGNIFILICSEL